MNINDILGSIFGEGFNALDALGLAGGGLLTKEAYDRLEEIGDIGLEAGRELGTEGLKQTEFKPFGVTTTTGGMFNYDPVTGEVRMSASPEEETFQRQMFGEGQRMMEEGAGDIGARTMELYDLMRAGQMPEEERQRLQQEERLLSQGRLGVQTAQYGGTPEQLALSKAQEEAKTRSMLGARQLAQGEAAQQFGMGQQMLGTSYLPQQQLLAAQQASQLFPQLQQRGQLYGAGLYGEGVASGLDMLLASGLGQATMMGNLGSGLLGGIFGLGK